MSCKPIVKKALGGREVIKGYIFKCDILECESNRTTEDSNPRRPPGWVHIRIDREKEELNLEGHVDLCLHHSRHLAELLGPIEWHGIGGGDSIITERIDND